jgi:predicted  nucleic acid-binding Zn-ribbon protein
MSRSASHAVTNAHAELRKLRNQIHEIEQGHLPLLGKIQGLEVERDRLLRKLEDAERLASAYQNAFSALVEAVHESNRSLASGKLVIHKTVGHGER